MGMPVVRLPFTPLQTRDTFIFSHYHHQRPAQCFAQINTRAHYIHMHVDLNIQNVVLLCASIETNEIHVSTVDDLIHV